MPRKPHLTNWLLVATVALSFGCRSSEPAAPAKGDLVILASGDTKGYIEPHDCVPGLAGGMSRRATLARDLAADRESMLVSVGGAVAGAAPYDVESLRAIMAGEAAMGYAAHNLGTAELMVGIDRVGGAAGDITFVATNTEHYDSLLAERSVIVERSGWRILVLGVIEPELTAVTAAEDPKESIETEMAARQGEFDDAVVLAYMTEPSLVELAKSLPKVSVIIGNPVPQDFSPRRYGKTLLTTVGDRGESIARVTGLASDQTQLAWSSDIHRVSGKLKPDETQKENLESFRQRLGELDFPAQLTRFSIATPKPVEGELDIEDESQKEASFVGSQSCKECHGAENESWQSNPHAHAWQSLEKVGAHFDSVCQACHTTGFGLPGGFSNRQETIDHVGVGCESCHGPSSQHVADPMTKTPWVARDSCTTCHDQLHSSAFDLETYWAKIAHGKPAAE